MRISDWSSDVCSSDLVQQHDLLYAGTIAENIAFFDPQLDLAQVLRCARLACVDDDIARLPMGYDSLVGVLGSSLSGGQRQRFFLARVPYPPPHSYASCVWTECVSTCRSLWAPKPYQKTLYLL